MGSAKGLQASGSPRVARPRRPTSCDSAARCRRRAAATIAAAQAAGPSARRALRSRSARAERPSLALELRLALLHERGHPFAVVLRKPGFPLQIALEVELRIKRVPRRGLHRFLDEAIALGRAGGTYFLPRLVGSARAMGLALLGERLSAEDAER